MRDGPWASPSTLTELLDASGASEGLLALQPTFTCKLFDLGATDEAGLRRRRLTVQTLLLRLIAVPGGQHVMNRLCSYVATVSNDDPKHLRAAYARISKTSEEQYMTVAEKLREEGRQEGRQEGEQESLKRGVQLAMLTLIEQRFGKVPAEVVRRIKNTRAVEIDQWMRRILAAATLDDLLT